MLHQRLQLFQLRPNRKFLLANGILVNDIKYCQVIIFNESQFGSIYAVFTPKINKNSGAYTQYTPNQSRMKEEHTSWDHFQNHLAFVFHTRIFFEPLIWFSSLLARTLLFVVVFFSLNWSFLFSSFCAAIYINFSIFISFIISPSVALPPSLSICVQC